MQMVNQYEQLDRRLAFIEGLLLDLKHKAVIPNLPDRGNIALASEVTGYSRKAIYQMVTKGHIPHHVVDGQIEFSRRELEAWMTAGNCKSASTNAA